MPPVFIKESFLFTEGEVVPEHEEDWPRLAARDLGKWCILGFDTFAGEHYCLATDIDREEDAVLLATARLRHLEVTQPTITSGGQAGDAFSGGIQDRVYLISADSVKPVRFNPPQSELFGNSPENPAK